jgi:hypothetical protein
MSEKIGQEVTTFKGYGCCKEIRDVLQKLNWRYTIQGFALQPQRDHNIYLCINVSSIGDSCIRYVVKQAEDLPSNGKKFFSPNRRTNKVTAEKLWKGGDVRIRMTEINCLGNMLHIYYPSEDVLLSVCITPSLTDK